MPMSTWRQRMVPLGLGVAMLATLVAAALSPNIGAVPAQSNCQYTTCTSGTSTPFPWWIVGVIAVIVVALLAAYLTFGRRRPPSGGGKGPAAWEPPAGASAGGAAPTEGPTTPASPAAPAGGEAGAPPYLETPEDVGAVLPAVGAGAAGGAAAGTAAAGAEEEPDIDSLMAELDKISGEILKKAPKTGSDGAAAGNAAEDTGK